MKRKSKADKKIFLSDRYEEYIKSLSESENLMLSNFFAEFDSHCTLPKSEKIKLLSDFKYAFLKLSELGIPTDESLHRLDIKNLGGFYSRPPILWYALDNAAKIYPLSMKRGQMAVFRLSFYMKTPVIPELLQMALTFTVKRFPGFATTVKKGFFWHYLDTAKRRFSIEPDNGLPCRPLKISGSGSQSFRVIYCVNRISVEFFHILTDGTGGTVFLKTLTAEYLRLAGLPSPYTDGILDINATPAAEDTSNCFRKADGTLKNSGFTDKPALQMSGKLSSEKPFRVLHFKINAEALSSVAKRYGVTVTAYVLAVMFISQRYATDESNGDISIQVPVNMRKFYPCATLRNFSMYCGIRLKASLIDSLQNILPLISGQLTEKTSKQKMSEMMNSTQNMVNAVRFIPLFIKAPVARLVYGFLGDKIFSNTLSNLGVVKMPSQIAEHIESMDFVLGTALTNRAGCSLITYGDTATLSISKMTSDPSFEEKLYELFTEDGLSLKVEGSVPIEN